MILDLEELKKSNFNDDGAEAKGPFQRLVSGVQSYLNVEPKWERHIAKLAKSIQQEERDLPQSPFHFVKVGNLSALKNYILLHGDQVINIRDTCGGTLFHTAYLYDQFRICHWLIENYPRQALHPFSQIVTLSADVDELPTYDYVPTFIEEDRLLHYESFRSNKHSIRRKIGLVENLYQTRSITAIVKGKRVVKDNMIEIPQKSMLYTGENILHIAIVRRNLEETRWLLDFYKNHQYSVPGGLQALLCANVTGSFFSPKKSLYFGGYPLHFAVCANDVEMFDLVLSFASATMPSNSKLRRSKSAKQSMQSHLVITNSNSNRNNTYSNNYTNTNSSNKGNQSPLSKKSTHHSLIETLHSSNNQYNSNFAGITTNTNNNINNPNSNSHTELSTYLPPPCDRSLYVCDHYGNNVLHFCVIHGLKDMYRHIRRTAARMIRRELKVAVANLRKSLTLPSDLKKSVTIKFRLDAAFRVKDFRGNNNNNISMDNTNDNATDSNNSLLNCYPPIETDLVISFDNQGGSVPESWFDEMVHKKVEERLVRVLNCTFHSPVTFAADMTISNCKNFNMKCDAQMLDLLLEEEFTLNWQYGPTQSSLIKIIGLEKAYSKNQYQLRAIPPTAVMHGVIEWLCISKFEDAITIPVIAQLIQNKWKVLGRPNFGNRFILHAIFTFFMTVIAYYPYRVPFATNVDSYREIVADRFVALAFICNIGICCYNLLSDAPYLFRQGLDWWGFHGGIRGSARFDRFLRTALVFSFSVVISLKGAILKLGVEPSEQYHVGTDGDIVSTLERCALAFVSICVGVCWIYFFFFFLGYKELAPFLLIIYRIMTNDFTYFFQFYSVIVVSFGIPLSVLTNQGSDSASYGFFRSLLAMWLLLKDTVNLSNSDNEVLALDSADNSLKWLMDFYITFFYVLVVLLLVNLLIGMIGSTYGAFIENPLGLVLLEQYNILCAMERNSSSDRNRRRMLKYATSMVVTEIPVDIVVHSPGIGSIGSVGSACIASGGTGMEPFELDSAGNLTNRSGASDTNNNNTGMSISQRLSKRLNSMDSSNEDVDGALQDTNSSVVNNEIIFEFEFEEFNEKWKSQPTSTAKGLDSQLIALLIIDPQEDYHEDINASTWTKGAVSITGSHHIYSQIGELIESYKDAIGDIIVTLQSHHRYHICHPCFWVNCTTHEHPIPDPYVVITVNDYGRVWKPADSHQELWCKQYFAELERLSGSDGHILVWPEHCVMGTIGHSIVKDISAPILEWEMYHGRTALNVMKGQNQRVEIYSSLEADIEDPMDISTSLNEDLLNMLKIYDKVLICGSVLSHNVNQTVRSLSKHWSKDMSRIVILKDGCTEYPDPVFKEIGKDFLEDMRAEGLKVMSIHECAELILDPAQSSTKQRYVTTSNNSKKSRIRSADAKAAARTSTRTSASAAVATSPLDIQSVGSSSPPRPTAADREEIRKLEPHLTNTRPIRHITSSSSKLIRTLTQDIDRGAFGFGQLNEGEGINSSQHSDSSDNSSQGELLDNFIGPFMS